MASKPTQAVESAVDTAANAVIADVAPALAETVDGPVDTAINHGTETLIGEAGAEAKRLAADLEQGACLAENEALNAIRSHFGHHPQVAEALNAKDLDAATEAVKAVTAPTDPKAAE